LTKPQTNLDAAAHTVTDLDRAFNSGSMSSGNSYSRTFSEGTFDYYCIFYPYMKGTIVFNKLPQS
jgi:plastocyanin